MYASCKALLIRVRQVQSDVSDQPIGDSETCTGAQNRARNSFECYAEYCQKRPHYGVGLEGGVEFSDKNSLECFAWCVVYDGFQFGTAKSASFSLPKAIGDLVAGGMELGHADDQVFGTVNSKQGQGAIGQLTKGLITRTQYYEPIVILACVPFMWPGLYPRNAVATGSTGGDDTIHDEHSND